MRPLFALALPALAAAALAGCGNKGPLVLPAKPTPAATPVVAPAPAATVVPPATQP